MRTVIALLAILAGAGLCAGRAAAIEINLAFDTPADQFPSYDPDGSKLAAISYAAAEIWKDLLPSNSHSYSVGIHYGQFSASSTQLAVYNDFDHTINVRSNNVWFLDPTPDEHGEFGDFTQEFYRGISAGQQNSFVGGIPDLLEVGYFAAGVSGDAATADDMLTVMVHEMGHFTEIGWNLLKPDVSLQPQFLGWRPGLAVKRENESHILPDNALMDPLITVGRRTLPSALDVIVAANEQNHSALDLKRVDWIGDMSSPATNFWFWDSGWVGGSEPDSATDAAIRDQADVVVTSLPGSARMLLVAEKSTLTVLDHLTVNLDGEIRGEGTSDHPKIIVASGGELSVDRNLDIGLGSLEIDGGSANIGNLLILDGSVETPGFINTSSLRGHGNVVVGGQLRNRGYVYAENGTLEITADAGGDLDLDGNQEATEIGFVRARDGNLILDGPLHDAFNSEVDVRNGHWVRFSEEFTFGSGSQLTFQESPSLSEFYSPSPSSHVLLDGASVTVLSDSIGRIRAGTISLQNGADLYVNDGGILGLNGEIKYHGGSYKGAGTLRQNGDATVLQNTTIEVAQYDWDGNGLSPPAHTTVADDVKFTLKVDGFATGAVYGGQTDLENHAELDVNITAGFGIWRLDQQGLIRFLKNGRLKGSPVIVQGQLEAVEGTSHVDAHATLTASSVVTIQDNAALRLNNQVVYGGGIITTKTGEVDESSLHQHDLASVLGEHHITVGYFDWDASDLTDSSTTISPDGHLHITTKQIGNGLSNIIIGLARSGFGDTITINSGKLTVYAGYEGRDGFFPDRWTLNSTGIVNLNHVEHTPPQVIGSRLVNRGTIRGDGEFIAPLENHGVVEVGYAGAAGFINTFGDLLLAADGTLGIDLGGTTPYTEHDRLYVGNGGKLGGTLDVSLLPSYIPTYGDIFRIIDANEFNGISGTFDTVNLPSVPGKWDVIYGAHYVDLRYAVPEPSSMVLAVLAIAAAAFSRTRRKHDSGTV